MKTLLKGFGVILILLVLCVLYIIKSSGAFRSIKPHFDGETEVLESPAGVEDITIDQNSGQIYMAASDRRDFNSPGEIYTFHVSEASPKFKSLGVAKANPEFRAHGISLLKKYGNTYVFAVSHEPKGDFIYRFEIENDSIVGQKKFGNPEFHVSINDVVATDTATFYFTNDHGLKHGLEREIKDFMLDKNGYAVLYHNGNYAKVSQDIAYPNGINVSPDGKYLYVASTTEGVLYVYENDISGEPLKMVDSHYAASGLDNIELDADGNLLIGSHPKLLKFLSHAKHASNRSPSQVLKIVYLPETDYKFLQEELYLDNGDPLSGSSVAAFYLSEGGKNDLFVGSVYEPKILRLHRNL
ncbi:SMP-30/gluconolactonase/LRE family protein [uncultured Arcticibacterium sp.]|uniref:SMP-30/gluconolactonase/LRE family protein n=1 Tax=uncultured Arcticibacterium sp. TaxID=2173042 RepID=UPI0030F6A47A